MIESTCFQAMHSSTDARGNLTEEIGASRNCDHIGLFVVSCNHEKSTTEKDHGRRQGQGDVQGVWCERGTHSGDRGDGA